MLIQYLTSPLWKIPIYEFLDEHCIVFDEEEENKFEYTDVHNVNILYVIGLRQKEKKKFKHHLYTFIYRNLRKKLRK
jgi:hypothetical protein